MVCFRSCTLKPKGGIGHLLLLPQPHLHQLKHPHLLQHHYQQLPQDQEHQPRFNRGQL